MPEKRLRATLEELHRELEQAEAVDEEARTLLDDALRDIRAVLDRPGGEPPREADSLVERLSVWTERFEESHPALTAAVNRVASALSHLGI